jgi:hypothetical protein
MRGPCRRQPFAYPLHRKQLVENGTIAWNDLVWVPCFDLQLELPGSIKQIELFARQLNIALLQQCGRTRSGIRGRT